MLKGTSTYRQYQDLVCVTSHSRIHHSNHFSSWKTWDLAHTWCQKRLLSWIPAALRGRRHQDLGVIALPHSFHVKTLLHRWKFLSVPNDSIPALEPLVKKKRLRTKILTSSSKPLAFKDWFFFFYKLSKPDPGEYGVLLGDNMSHRFIFYPPNKERNTFYW